jgi:hypothetical protein
MKKLGSLAKNETNSKRPKVEIATELREVRQKRMKRGISRGPSIVIHARP